MLLTHTPPLLSHHLMTPHCALAHIPHSPIYPSVHCGMPGKPQPEFKHHYLTTPSLAPHCSSASLCTSLHPLDPLVHCTHQVRHIKNCFWCYWHSLILCHSTAPHHTPSHTFLSLHPPPHTACQVSHVNPDPFNTRHSLPSTICHHLNSCNFPMSGFNFCHSSCNCLSFILSSMTVLYYITIINIFDIHELASVISK